MKTIKVVLKKPENGIDTVIINGVVRHSLKNGTFTIENYDERVWEFGLDVIRHWEIVNENGEVEE